VLADAIANGVDFGGTEEALKSHPVAIWLESAIALEAREGQLVRGRPRQLREIAGALAGASGQPEEECRTFLKEILQWISLVNQRLQDSGRRYTLLPFKLHQFISQTGSVYTTLDQDENRFITLEPGVYRVEDGAKKPIFRMSSRAPADKHSYASPGRATGSKLASSGPVRTKKKARLMAI
jgi:hypothetical protein